MLAGGLFRRLAKCFAIVDDLQREIYINQTAVLFWQTGNHSAEPLDGHADAGILDCISTLLCGLFTRYATKRIEIRDAMLLAVLFCERIGCAPADVQPSVNVVTHKNFSFV